VAARRAAVVAELVDTIAEARRPHPVRVAIDGPDAAGKTTLADELAAGLRGRGRETIRASIDGFHRPRAARYRRGPDSPEGYYEDSFDYASLRKALLDPLGPSGSRSYRRAAFDHRADRSVLEEPEVAAVDAVLLFDGVFLLRPELAGAWDLRVFVSVRPEESLRRALERDLDLFGSREEVERRYRTRYLPGQRLYAARARPAEQGDVVVENNDPARPSLRRP
jgi:uridine kinase